MVVTEDEPGMAPLYFSEGFAILVSFGVDVLRFIALMLNIPNSRKKHTHDDTLGILPPCHSNNGR
jgi:hypothetical protein